MRLGRRSSDYHRQHSCCPAYRSLPTTSWRTTKACGSSDIITRCAFPSRPTLWRVSRPSSVGARWRASSVKSASGLSWNLGSNKSLGRHTRASSSGRIFDLPLIPESVRWARRIRRHWGSWADACDVEAWEHAGIAVDEPHAFGGFVDGHLAAVARYRAAWGETAHIGVVTHPAYRGRRYGSAVVSAATAQPLEAGFIVLYQTLLANAPSVSLATGLAARGESR